MASSVDKSIAILDEIHAQAHELGAVLAGNRDDLARAADLVEKIGATQLRDVPGLFEDARSGYSECENDLAGLRELVTAQRELIDPVDAAVAPVAPSSPLLPEQRERIDPVNAAGSDVEVGRDTQREAFMEPGFIAAIIKDEAGRTEDADGNLVVQRRKDGKLTYTTKKGQKLYYESGQLRKLEEGGGGDWRSAAGRFGLDPTQIRKIDPFKSSSGDPVYTTEWDMTGAFQQITVKAFETIGGIDRYEMTANKAGVIEIMTYYGNAKTPSTILSRCYQDPDFEEINDVERGSAREKTLSEDSGLIGHVFKRASERSTENPYTRQEKLYRHERKAKRVGTTFAKLLIGRGAAAVGI